MTVAGHIVYALRARHVAAGGNPGSRREVLELVGLQAPCATGIRYELSGGQQQRSRWHGRSPTDPQVLLLDEPLSNLDAELRAQMRVELRRVHERTGLTTILVTHDQAEALSMSDEVVLMQLGKIVDLGGPRGLYQRPATLPTATFVGASNILRGPSRMPRPGDTVGPARRARTASARDGVRSPSMRMLESSWRSSPRTSRSASTHQSALRRQPGQMFGLQSHLLRVAHAADTADAEGGEIELRAWGDKNSLVAVGDEVVARLPSERVLVLLSSTA